jgi:hypothetical protein
LAKAPEIHPVSAKTLASYLSHIRIFGLHDWIREALHYNLNNKTDAHFNLFDQSEHIFICDLLAWTVFSLYDSKLIFHSHTLLCSLKTSNIYTQQTKHYNGSWTGARKKE